MPMPTVYVLVEVYHLISFGIRNTREALDTRMCLALTQCLLLYKEEQVSTFHRI